MTNQQDGQKERMQRLGVAVRLTREKRGLSIRDFAYNIGMDSSTLHRIENGTTLNPSVFLMEKLAKALDVTVDELMNFRMKECPTCNGSGWIKE